MLGLLVSLSIASQVTTLGEAPIETTTIELSGTTSSNGWTCYGGPMLVNQMELDPSGNAVWLATTVGLVRYDLHTGDAKRWTTLDGLTDNFVRDLTIDREGRVYAATFSGLSRLDPASGRFTCWAPEEIGHHDLSAVAIDHQGRPWVGCTGRYPQGAMCLKEKVWLMYNDGVMHTRMPDVVDEIAVDSQGGIWLIGTYGGIQPFAGYYSPQGPYISFIDRTGNPTTVPLPTKDGKEVSPRGLVFPADGVPVLLDRQGTVFRMEVKEWLEDEGRRIPDFLQAGWSDLSAQLKIAAPVMAARTDEKGIVWIATRDGIGPLSASGHEPRVPAPVRDGLIAFVLAPAGEFLAAGTPPGVFRWRNGKWAHIVNRLDGPIGGDRGYPVHGGAIGRGIDGRLYFTRGRTVAFDGTNWTVQDRPDGTIRNRLRQPVAASWQDPQSGKWLIQFRGEKASRTHEEFFKVPCFKTTLVDSHGHFWQVDYQESKFLEFTGKEIIDHAADCPYLFRRYRTYFESRIYNVLEDAKGTIWAFTIWGGLLRHDGGAKWSLVGSKFQGMMGGQPWKMCCNGDTIVCTGSWGTSEYHIPTGTWRNYVRKGVHAPEATAEYPGTMVEYAAPDREGRIWYGFYEAGLCVREKDGSLTHYTTAHGLANNSVWGIYTDDDGSLWFTTFSGASHFDPKRSAARPGTE
jgi:ligand-binding sensor domain-containing protein